MLMQMEFQLTAVNARITPSEEWKKCHWKNDEIGGDGGT